MHLTSNFPHHPAIGDSDPDLVAAIAQQIATSSQQRITFAEYMDLALYHPLYGYYATQAINLGKRGDFFTSPHLGADFGELLATQFVQFWEILGRSQPFTLVEMGAGQGILAGDILHYLQQHHPEFWAILDYVIIEKSAALRQLQQQRLRDLPVRWCGWDEIANHSIVGCCFSNELVDALPVHQFIIKQGQLQEVYLSTEARGAEPKLIEVIDQPANSELSAYFDLVNLELPSSAYPDGYRSEVNLAALSWLKTVAAKLQQGYLLTIDYGYLASRYYSPARSHGTLQCYYRHQRHDNPYINIGRQDITAHVDFTALERWGEVCGLTQVGFTPQALFLMALGLGDRLASLSTTANQSVQQLLQRRDALHQLIDPLGLGGFGVLVQSHGLTAAQMRQTLTGFSLPAA